MKYDLAQALTHLRPGAQWVIRGTEYSGLEWLENNTTTKPTEAELNAKIDELHEGEALRLLRIKRDKKLNEVEWEVTKALTTTGTVPVELKDYMQALRDLPATATPTLNSMYELDETSFEWPIRG